MSIKRITAKKYSGGYFLYWTGTYRLIATFKKYYPDHYGVIEFNNGKIVFPVNSLNDAKRAIMSNLQELTQ